MEDLQGCQLRDTTAAVFCSHQVVEMDLSLSLWCEEVDDDLRQEQAQNLGHIVKGSTPLRATWDPTVTGKRVIQKLLHIEERYLPSTLYIALIQKNPQQREELTQWTLDVCFECGCDEAVFPLSISLIDRFLSASLSLPISPYCLAAGCILIASKLIECDNVTADSLCAAAENNFEASSLRDMERVILATLRWDTAAVTPQDFLPHFLVSVAERERASGNDNNTNEGEDGLLSTLRRHSDTLAVMCVCNSRFLGVPPSLVAASSLLCALRGLAKRGGAQLLHTSKTLAELCETDLAVLQYYSDMIEYGLHHQLRSSPRISPSAKDEEIEDERARTPTDMREIDF